MKAIKRTRYSSYQLVSHLGTSTTLFPAIWTKTARSIEELFSQWKRPKRASSDQRTDEQDTSCMQQQPRQWPGFAKCVETKLRLDVYIRPWPPGWSFLRRIYTSRGSQRVKKRKKKRMVAFEPATIAPSQNESYRWWLSFGRGTTVTCSNLTVRFFSISKLKASL